jgi:hypothetical protein
VSPTRSITESGLLEASAHFTKAALFAPAQMRAALELRSLMYSTAARLHRPRDVEALFALGRLQGHNPKLAMLC